MQTGTNGIAWIHRQLFDAFRESNYKHEFNYWMDRTFSFEEKDIGYAGFDIQKEKEKNAFGLLEGLAGIAFFLFRNSID